MDCIVFKPCVLIVYIHLHCLVSNLALGIVAIDDTVLDGTIGIDIESA